MTRLTLLSLAVLSACHQPGSAAGFRDRNPAMRTADYGYSYDLVHPRSDNESVKAIAVSNDVAVVLTSKSSSDCLDARLHHADRVRGGVRAPSRRLSVCPIGSEEVLAEVSTADGLLLVADQMYRRDATGRYESIGRVPLRRDLELLDHAVIDAENIAMLTDETLYLFHFDGTDWIEHARLPSVGEQVVARGDVLANGRAIYHFDGTSWVDDGQTRSRSVLDVLDERSVQGDERGQVVSPPVGTKVGGRYAALTPYGYAFVDASNEEVAIVGLDGVVIDRFEGGYSGYKQWVVAGEESLLYVGSRHHVTWVHLTDGPPPDLGLLELQETVSKAEWVRGSFEVPVGKDTLTVQLEGSGDADLYLAHETEPTYTSYVCSPYRAGSDELCQLELPAAGTWHVGVNGFAPSSDFVLRAFVE